jgi:DNA-binding transcriptional LysR family regulator
VAGFTPSVVQRQAGQNCLALVAAGAGVLLVPEAPGAVPEPPGLRRVSLDVPEGAPLWTEVYVAWRAAGDEPVHVRALVEAAG